MLQKGFGFQTSSHEKPRAKLGPVSGAGQRGLLAFPAVPRLARSTQLLSLVRPHLVSEPVPVRAIYFDKSHDANWLVRWHQDLSLAVRTRADMPGFGAWNTKDGIPHVQAPTEPTTATLQTFNPLTLLHP